MADCSQRQAFLPARRLADFKIYQFLVTLIKPFEMKNTSVSLGNYFDEFVQSQVAAGSYKNISEVIRAGLRLLESEESKAAVLRNAIQEGIDSGVATNINREDFLEDLKQSVKK